MQASKPSASAETVTVVRAQLHRMGVVNDPFAESMLSARSRWLLRAFELPVLRRYPRNATFSFLAARTRFFDETVTAALNAGVTQVVIVGAGYDSRAWRLARPDVRFFEVDHPATQAEKRLRAPAGPGPVFVGCDLVDGDVVLALTACGLDPGARTVFVVEGLTMYLSEASVRAVFTALARTSATGSRLAANFTVDGGGSVSPLSRTVASAKRAQWARGGEPTHQWVRPDALNGFLAGCGWTVTETVLGPELAAHYLEGSVIPTTGVSPGAICVSTQRAADYSSQ